MEPLKPLTIDIPKNCVGVVLGPLGPLKDEMPKTHNRGYV
jgi:predicted membrane GTPase involved in stress response